MTFDLLPGDWTQRAPCSAASAPARALVWSAHRPWPYADTRHRHIRTPHWRLDGLSTMPGEGCGLRPPAPVLRGGSRIAAISSPRHAQKSTSRTPSHAPYRYILNPENLSPPQSSSRGLPEQRCLTLWVRHHTQVFEESGAMVSDPEGLRPP